LLSGIYIEEVILSQKSNVSGGGGGEGIDVGVGLEVGVGVGVFADSLIIGRKMIIFPLATSCCCVGVAVAMLTG